MSTEIRDPERAAVRTSRGLATGTLIGFYCVGHRVRSIERSPLTIHHKTWSFCVSGCGTGHRWVAITPVSLEQLMLLGPRPRVTSGSPARHGVDGHGT